MHHHYSSHIFISRQKYLSSKPHNSTTFRGNKDLPKYPDPEYFLRTPLPRFPSMIYQHIFETSEFHIIDCRYINRQFFQFAVPHIYERLVYYKLEPLVNCTSNINIDLCKEFYVNLRPTSIVKSHSITTVAGRPIELSPDLIRTFLGLCPSSNPFVCFPEITEVTGSFAHETITNIHEYYFNCPRDESRTKFDVTKLSVDQYVWYRIVIDCILPIMPRDRSMMSISHMVMMFALEASLDIDISTNIYHHILYHSEPINGKIYMPFCHIITSFLASQGIDTAVGTVKCLSKDYDQLGPRHLKTAGIIYSNGGLRWMKSDNQTNSNPESDFGNNELEPKNMNNDERLDRLEDTINAMNNRGKTALAEIRELRKEIRIIAKKQHKLYEQQLEVVKEINLLHKSFHTPETSTSSSDDDTW